MANTRIREAASSARVHNWEIARALGVSEFTFSRKLRDELPETTQCEILDIIDRLARGVAIDGTASQGRR